MARAGLNKRTLATASGLSEGTIGNYARDEQTPRIPEMIRLAKALGIEVDVLFAHVMAERARIIASGGPNHHIPDRTSDK